MPDPGKDPGKEIRSQAKAWAIATGFVFTVAAGGLIGFLVQRWLWTAAAPWPILVGLGAGLVLGMVRFIQEAREVNK